MKRVFITGGSGFIGRSLIRQLHSRGTAVTALARTDDAAATVAALGATPTPGDVTDRESLRAAMDGCDTVFHLAAWHGLGITSRAGAQRVNVDGTRNVLTLAAALDIPRIIYTSTVAVLGGVPRNFVPDETYRYDGPFDLIDDETKWLAHYHVVEPLIEHGAPITVVMPGAVYGPGDAGLIAQLMRLFYQGWLPFIPGPDATFCFSHVDDIAAGHILAAEKGEPAASYILAGPPVPLSEMFDFWANITGKPAPAGMVAAHWLRPLGPVIDRVYRPLGLPPAFSAEALAVLGKQYVASSNRARAELGWRERSLQAGMLETFDWIAATTPMPMVAPRQAAAGALLGTALLLGGGYALSRARHSAESAPTTSNGTTPHA